MAVVEVRSPIFENQLCNDNIRSQLFCKPFCLVFIKGAPRSASKLSIDPINSHASYFGKSTGLNKRSVPINGTMCSNWHQRVRASLDLSTLLDFCLLK